MSSCIPSSRYNSNSIHQRRALLSHSTWIRAFKSPIAMWVITDAEELTCITSERACDSCQLRYVCSIRERGFQVEPVDRILTVIQLFLDHHLLLELVHLPIPMYTSGHPHAEEVSRPSNSKQDILVVSFRRCNERLGAVAPWISIYFQCV